MDGRLALEPGWLAAAVLLSLRLGASLVATPILGSAVVPLRVRVLIVLALTVALAPVLGLMPLPGDLGAGRLLGAALTELALGATLGLGIILPFAAVAFAGQLVGVQIGFGLGQVIDPSSRAGMPLLASAFGQAAVLVFFLVDGHHALLRGLAFSVERFPVGRPWPLEAGLGPLVNQVAGLFTLGFALAAPVVLSLLLVEFALGVLSRNLPQLNMLVIGIPVKIVAGVLALALWSSSGMGDVLTRVYGSIFRTWDAIFIAAAEAPAGIHEGRAA